MTVQPWVGVTLIGATAVVIALLVYLAFFRREGEVGELPADLLQRIGSVVGQIVIRVMALGRRLTPEQVTHIARWTFRHVDGISGLFTETEWIGFVTALLALATQKEGDGLRAAVDMAEIDTLLSGLRW